MLRISQAFAPVLAANGGGALLNVLSIASWINGPALGGVRGHEVGRVGADATACATSCAAQKTQVLALHMAFVDTDLTRASTSQVERRSEIVASASTALEAGADEVLADELTRQVKRACRRSPACTCRRGTEP